MNQILVRQLSFVLYVYVLFQIYLEIALCVFVHRPLQKHTFYIHPDYLQCSIFHTSSLCNVAQVVHILIFQKKPHSMSMSSPIELNVKTFKQEFNPLTDQICVIGTNSPELNQ